MVINYVAGNYIEGKKELNNPGDFIYYVDKEDKIIGMIFVCPCGCSNTADISFGPRDGINQAWTWNGNIEKPTLTPSLHNPDGCGYHGFLTGGVFREC